MDHKVKKASQITGNLEYLLLIVCESLVDHLADTGVQALQLLVLGRDVGRGGLGGENAHEAREQRVHGADHLVIGARHAGRDAALQRLEARQNNISPLKQHTESMSIIGL